MVDADTAPAADPGADAPEDAPDAMPAPRDTADVEYSCLRCGTRAKAAELERLPEIKCICGFRVFVKNRPPVVKSVNAV